MPNPFQDFMAVATQQAALDLTAALMALPEDKRGWSPADTARTGLSMVAECALNNGITAEMIEARAWKQFGGSQDVYFQKRAELAAGDWEALQALLTENTHRLTATIQAVSDDALGIEVTLPYGIWTLSGVIAYPYWNMMYHQGQINYIASILG